MCCSSHDRKKIFSQVAERSQPSLFNQEHYLINGDVEPSRGLLYSYEVLLSYRHFRTPTDSKGIKGKRVESRSPEGLALDHPE